eukprot:gene33124-40068_t
MTSNYAYMVLFYLPVHDSSEPKVLVLRRQKSPVWFAHPPMQGKPMERFLADHNYTKVNDIFTYYLPEGISYDKYFKGKYAGRLCFPGGQANVNESIEECAKREFREETGVDINNYNLSLRLGVQSWQMAGMTYGMLYIQLSPVDFQQVKNSILQNFRASDQYRASIVQQALSSLDFTPASPPLTDDEFTAEPLHTVAHDKYGGNWEMTLTEAKSYFSQFRNEGMDWFLQFVQDLQGRIL